MKIEGVRLEPPEGFQLIIGQAHFIKSVEDLYETLATSMPRLKFGIAFCEASGKSLVRFDGSDKRCTKMARDFASRLGAGHSFVVILSGAFPINVLNRIKGVEEVTGVFCATSNPVTVVVADQAKGRGILGVIDGVSPSGAESPKDKRERQEFLRKIGYKR
ncbi:MAG TPA: adenosine-specific kinase [Nitrososphaerales archaeon]|nr:adenosine-specific kinase [Nitrososphaerales archaeon]